MAMTGFNILTLFPVTSSAYTAYAGGYYLSGTYLESAGGATLQITQSNNGTDGNQAPNALRNPHYGWDKTDINITSNAGSTKVSQGGFSCSGTFTLTFPSPRTVLGVYGKWQHSASAEGSYGSSGSCVITANGSPVNAISTSGNIAITETEYTTRQDLVSQVVFSFQAYQDRGGDNPDASNSGNFSINEIGVYVDESGYGLMVG